MLSNDKRRKWIISLGFSEADAENFIKFELPDWKIKNLAKRRHKPEPEKVAETVVKQKPEVIPTGMFWCTHCKSLHRIASKAGKRHLKYQEET